MSVIQGVLFEEVQRLQEVPSGSLFIRKMGNSSFAYLKRKEHGKVVSVYLGNINNQNVKDEIEKNRDYKRIKANLRSAGLELNKLKKAYKVYER